MTVSPRPRRKSPSQADLPKHLVLCTANHSCRDRLRRTDAALKQFVSRVQRRKSRIAQTMREIKPVYSTPFPRPFLDLSWSLPVGAHLVAFFDLRVIVDLQLDQWRLSWRRGQQAPYH